MAKRAATVFFVITILTLTLIPFVAAASGFPDMIQGFLDFVEKYPAALSTILYFIFFLALFWVGLTRAAEILKWDLEKTKNARVGIALTLGLMASLSLVLQGYTLTAFSDKISKVILPLLVLVPLFLIGYLMSKNENHEQSHTKPYLVAAGFIAVYYLLKWILGNEFPDNLGDWSWIIHVLFFIAAALIVWGLFSYLFTHLTRPRARQGLTDEQYESTRRFHDQKAGLYEAKHAADAKKQDTNAGYWKRWKDRRQEKELADDLRQARRDVRKLNTDIKESLLFLGKLTRLAGEGRLREFNNINEKYSKKLNRLKTNIGGYIGLLRGLLINAQSLTRDRQLETLNNQLLNLFEHYQQQISRINGFEIEDKLEPVLKQKELLKFVPLAEQASIHLNDINQHSISAFAILDRLNNQVQAAHEEEEDDGSGSPAPTR